MFDDHVGNENRINELQSSKVSSRRRLIRGVIENNSF